MASHTVKTIGKQVSQWGEGPIWWKDSLLYVDINGKQLIRIDPETGEEAVWDIGERIGTIVPTEGDDLVYAGDTGYVRFNPATRETKKLADPEASLRETNRFNDGKCDPAGRFWAGSISLVKNKGTANLYCLDTDGSLSLKLEGLTNSNGICWSSDAKTMYHIDTPTLAIRAFDYGLESGEISNGRVVIDTAAQGYDSSPDGMTIDENGNLWVAFCHGGCVVCFDPKEGAELQRVDFPCIETTACAFGGANFDRLFVTTGIKPGLNEPDAGKVFVVDGLGVRGLPAFPFKG
ncbi:MAG: SMP-30/gluconolactonase/LRE family protein [Lentimonas sp.]